MKAICCGVTASAAMIRSASFSRWGSSRTTTNSPFPGVRGMVRVGFEEWWGRARGRAYGRLQLCLGLSRISTDLSWGKTLLLFGVVVVCRTERHVGGVTFLWSITR